MHHRYYTVNPFGPKKKKKKLLTMFLIFRLKCIFFWGPLIYDGPMQPASLSQRNLRQTSFIDDQHPTI